MGLRRGSAVVAFALSVAGVAHADPPAAPAPPAAPPSPPAPPAPVAAPAPAFVPQLPMVAQQAPTETVPVYIVTDSDEHVVVGVYPEWMKPGQGPPLARCTTPCSLAMQRGGYRFDVEATDTVLEGNRVVGIGAPSRLVVTPRHTAQRTVGLVLGITGSVAVLVGSVLVLVALNDTNSCALDGFDCSRTVAHPSEAIAGALLVLGGAVAAPIGWVLFGKSHRPAIDVEPFRTSRRITPEVGVVPMPAGLGLGMGFKF